MNWSNVFSQTALPSWTSELCFLKFFLKQIFWLHKDIHIFSSFHECQQYVSLNCSLQKIWSQISHLNELLELWTEAVCFDKLPFWEKLWSQMSHLNGFFPSSCFSNAFFSKLAFESSQRTNLLFSKREVHSDLVQEIVFTKNHFIAWSRVGNSWKDKW